MLVMTRSINDRVARDTAFAIFVMTSLKYFLEGNWGQQHPDDKALNDSDPNLAMGCYLDSANTKIWIKSDYADEEGTKRVITVLFPSEY